MVRRCFASLVSRTTWRPLMMLMMLSTSLSSACRSTDLVGNDCMLNGAPCPDQTFGGGGTTQGTQSFDTLDLLFVVDNGPSMAAKQQELAQAIPTMIGALLSGQVSGGEFAPVTDLHVAVVSSDMGAPGISGLSDCGDDTGRPLGDDGLFVQRTLATSTVADESCEATPPTPEFLSFLAGVSDVGAMSQIAGCRTLIGTNGCSHAMPLEAALKALFNRPNSDAIAFINGNGHGLDRATTQGTFVRERAFLAVIIVTNNEDCSLRDMTPLTPSEQLDAAGVPMDRALRCWKAGDALYSVGRYQTGFGLIKGGLEERIYVGVIAGVPEDLAALINGTDVDARRDAIFEQILDDPRMQHTPVHNALIDTTLLKTSCGDAVPPRRLVELVRRFETQGQLGSICDNLMTPLQAMTADLARRLDPSTTL